MPAKELPQIINESKSLELIDCPMVTAIPTYKGYEHSDRCSTYDAYCMGIYENSWEFRCTHFPNMFRASHYIAVESFYWGAKYSWEAN